jgi:hypothetical protein
MIFDNQSPEVSCLAGTAEGNRALADDLDYSQEEWSRHEGVMLSISNPSTPEGAIAKRAYNRLHELVTEMDLDQSITDMAHQVSPPPLPHELAREIDVDQSITDMAHQVPSIAPPTRTHELVREMDLD